MTFNKFLGGAVLALSVVMGGQAISSEQLAANEPTADIVDTAVAADDFNTLVAAVQAAGLVDALKGEGPFTVFAPSDTAFSALPAGTVESLLQPENRETLVKVLTYHVIPGKVMSGDLGGKQLYAKTVEGQSVWIGAAGGKVFVNPTRATNVDSMSRVIAADIETTNGVIHVINKVLLPPNM